MDENQRREEFARVWLKSEPSVSAYVFASISGFHDAEDVVQQVAQTLARRFEIYLFHWDVYVKSAEGKYGITPDQTNPKTIAYVRASVKETLLTYPQIKRIGVTSGEDDRRELDNTPDSTENYLFKTYGLGIMDARADARWKARDFRFIWRRQGSEYEWAKEAMKNYTGGVMDTSTKYSVAHMYSSRRPQEWESRMVGVIEPVSVLWSSRIWDADGQNFKRALPTETGFQGPFEFVITRGKKLAITGMKNGTRQIAWSEDPNYEDWTGRFGK